MLPLLSAHVPKTAGTSFRYALIDIYGADRAFFDYGHITDGFGSRHPKVAPDAAVVHGHVWPGRHPSAEIITWVRDPIQRLVSHYEHFRREPTNPNPLAQQIHRYGMTFESFIEHPDMINSMTGMFGPIDYHTFSFIGISDDYEAEMLRAADYLRWHKIPVVARALKNPEKRATSYPVRDHLRDRIFELNQRDYEMYEYALAQRADYARKAQRAG